MLEMAKISANGATEVSKMKVESQSGYEYIIVMCSDGRILRRTADSGYTIAMRVSKKNATHDFLWQFATARGYSIVGVSRPGGCQDCGNPECDRQCARA